MQHRREPRAHRAGNWVADAVTLACVAGICAFVIVIGYAWFDPSHGSVGLKWTQPYGGCAEAWQAPHSKGADECRAHGWTVRARLVVGPHRWVRYNNLPHCREEDGSGQKSACTWNIGKP